MHFNSLQYMEKGREGEKGKGIKERKGEGKEE